MKQTTFMKSTKSLFCMILALVLVFSLCLPTASAQSADAEAPAAASAEDLAQPANVLPDNHNVITASTDPGKDGVYEIGETWVVDGQWEVTINSVKKHSLCNSYSNDRNDYTTEEVVLINYTYKNIGYDRDNGLFVASSSFDVYDQESESANTYACTHRKYAKACKIVGSKCTADEAYVLRNDSAFITLVISMYHAENGSMCHPLETATFRLYVDHTHSWIPATCTTAKTCSVCGITEGSAAGHRWDEGVVTVAPTCDTTGIITHTCTVCNREYNEELPARGHTYDKNVCQVCGYILTFTDVPNNSWYAEPVFWALGNGITNGIGETLFGPEQNCNRAQVVTFLWRAAESPEPSNTVNPFSDVKESDFFYKAVLWAVEEGITNGVSDTKFGPNQNCTRAQVVTFLWRAKGEPESTADVNFTDVQPHQFYTTAVAWAVENGITNGMDSTTFGVNGICTRAQIVTFLYRTLVQ